jgi:hypothetical protein
LLDFASGLGACQNDCTDDINIIVRKLLGVASSCETYLLKMSKHSGKEGENNVPISMKIW